MPRTRSLQTRTIRTPLALVLALALAAVLAPAAAQAKSFYLAVQDDDVMLGHNPYMPAAAGLDVTKEIGAKQIRVLIPWTKVLATDPTDRTAPKKPTYDFSQFDAAVAAAHAAGVTVQLTVTGPAPAWATHDHEQGVNQPDAKKFAAFAAAVASHFTNTVKAISIYNEPNYPYFLAPFKACKKVKGKKTCTDGRAAEYRDLYTRSYTAIKKVNKKMPVWIGELAPQGEATNKGKAPSPLAFLRDVLCVDKKVKHKSCSGTVKTDGVALHSYLLAKSPKSKPRYGDDMSMGVLSRASSLLTKLEKVKALRLSNGKTGVPIYLTEFGYLTISGSRGTTESRQATWIPQAIALAKKASRVRSLLLYQLIDPYNTEATWIGGLFHRDGTPKPVVAKLEK